MKYSKIRFGFISVLGVVFLTFFVISNYLKLMDAINVLATLSNEVLSVFLFVGISFLTIGIIGIGRLHLKKHKNFFTAIVAVVVPLLTFALVFLFIIVIIYPVTWFPMRSEITNVSVINNSPLVLSVDVEAITTRDSYIQEAVIRNIGDNEILTDCYLKPFYELPADSTQTFIFNFNETLPSGNYILQLGSWHNAHGSLQFAIP